MVGTDRNVDRRLPAAAEVEVPFYAGLEIGVPSLPGMVEVLAEGRFDLVTSPRPGPRGVIATLIARIMELPVLGSWHTELGAYAGLRSSSKELEVGVDAALRSSTASALGCCPPSPASDSSLRPPGRRARPHRPLGPRGGPSRFDPALRDPALPGRSRCSTSGGRPRRRGPSCWPTPSCGPTRRIPGCTCCWAAAPEEGYRRERLGDSATFLGWLEGDDLPRAYASADIFLFTSRTDTFGQVLVEAGASGLPVVAVAEGGPTSIVADGETGRLCAADPELIAAALLQLGRTLPPIAPSSAARAWRPPGRAPGRPRWPQLADGYAAVLEPEPSSTDRPGQVAKGDSPALRPRSITRG